MLTYNLSGKAHLYEALYDAIKNDILTGTIKPGEKLPSKRSLAEHLKISKVTVESAYSQLKAEGYIYSLEKKGYFADKVESIQPAKKPPEKHIESEKENILADLSGNTLQKKAFPFSVWIRLMREVVLDYESELLSPLPPKGAMPLRDAISDYLYRFRGISASANQIVIGAGTEYLYSLLVQLLGSCQIYAVEDPGYEKVRYVINANGGECIPVPVDNSGVCIKSLYKSNANILHLSPAHHFPTGIVTPAARRREISEWAAASDDRYIIEDDYDCEFRMSGMPIPPMQSTDSLGRVIYINTFSKSLCPSIRISYMVLPLELVSAFDKRLGFYSCTVASFEQYTLARFICDGYFEKHINRMKKHYRAIRDYAISSVKSSAIAKFVTIQEADAGLHFILEVKTDISDSNFCRMARKSGLIIKSLSDYYMNNTDKSTHRFIFNYSGAEADHIDIAVKILEKLI